MIKTTGFLIVAFAIGTVVMVIGREDNSKLNLESEAAQEIRRIHPVETFSILLSNNFEYQHDYLGEVVARRSSELGFERAGRIATMEISEGDTFGEGDLLAQLDTDQLQEQQAELVARVEQIQAKLDELTAGPRAETIAAAEATVKDLEHQLELANRNRDRRERLVAQAMSAREDLDIASFGAQSVKAKLDVARHQLDELQAGTREEILRAQRSALAQSKSLIAQNQIEMDRSILRAPYACTVTAQTADVGQVVAPGSTILSVVANKAPEVWVGVPVSATRSLEKGGSVTVQINGEIHNACVSNIVPQLDQATRTMTVILSLQEATIEQVPVGQTARFSLVQQIDQRGCWLPMTALIKGTRGLWSCLRLVEQQPEFESDLSVDQTTGKLERCDVEILHSDGDRVFVRSALDEGDLVVRSGTGRIAPQQWAYNARGAEAPTP